MVEFQKFILRHGEPAAQALIEYLERQEGIATDRLHSLEQRWNALSSQDDMRVAA